MWSTDVRKSASLSVAVLRRLKFAFRRSGLASLASLPKVPILASLSVAVLRRPVLASLASLAGVSGSRIIVAYRRSATERRKETLQPRADPLHAYAYTRVHTHTHICAVCPGLCTAAPCVAPSLERF
jgi:hypothetical protein